jgi:plasmid stabilization system protein ParE
MAGEEVRSRVCAPYRILYLVSGALPEIVAVLHTARDIPSILSSRIQ